MLGGMFSGHDECGGEIITKYYKTGEVTVTDSGFYKDVLEEKKFMTFYGSSSKTAQEKNGSSLKDYRASEGRTVLVPYRGSVKNTIQDILGGLRSACTYSGAKTLKDLPKTSTFVRVNNQLNKIYEKNTVGE